SSACTGGQQTWEIFPFYNLVNDSSGPQSLSVTGADYHVTWSDGSNEHQVSDVTVVDDGGFGPGVTLGTDHGAAHFGSQLEVTLPCDPAPVSADLTLTVTSDL